MKRRKKVIMVWSKHFVCIFFRSNELIELKEKNKWKMKLREKKKKTKTKQQTTSIAN